jgi:hypothetical protein
LERCYCCLLLLLLLLLRLPRQAKNHVSWNAKREDQGLEQDTGEVFEEETRFKVFLLPLFLFVIAVLSIVVFFLFLLPHEQTSLLML